MPDTWPPAANRLIKLPLLISNKKINYIVPRLQEKESVDTFELKEKLFFLQKKTNSVFTNQ